jgi:hypothetical protein
MLCLLERLPTSAHLKSEISNLKSLAESISRQLRGWADALRNSPIKGQPHLTEKTRRLDGQRRDREELMSELRAIRRRGSVEQP